MTLSHVVPLRFVALLALLALVALLSACSERDRPLESPVKLEGNIFGSFYQVTITDPLTQGEALELEDGIQAVLEDVDAAMSIYREDSELMLFNASPLGDWQPLSDQLIEVLAISQSVTVQSEGAFDVTIGSLVNLWSFGSEARPREMPNEAILAERLALIGPESLELDVQGLQARRLRDVFVDLGGVAKGHATDRVANYLNQHDILHYLVNLGGDLIVSGYRDGEAEPWKIGIEAPLEDRRQAQYIFPLNDISLASSGDYRNYFEQDGKRFSHTIDPRSGRPISHRLASVSVLHPSNAWADAWATALMVLGDEEGMRLARDQDLKVLMLVRENEGWSSIVTPAFVDHFGAALVKEMGFGP